ncbi:UNKNOWN [Stylonychia lemnae]|uniref:Uncharacterized protein n=1 Tax=Stylonychia lemnae TaxID=5949 RepID=A0A078ABR6_STYLE|nr:UNKNOWN [Stylonychia lemnae]|eukprot:CDW78223.1 UNKNOWN [Stylonychia lemnae]
MLTIATDMQKDAMIQSPVIYTQSSLRTGKTSRKSKMIIEDDNEHLQVTLSMSKDQRLDIKSFMDKLNSIKQKNVQSLAERASTCQQNQQKTLEMYQKQQAFKIGEILNDNQNILQQRNKIIKTQSHKFFMPVKLNQQNQEQTQQQYEGARNLQSAKFNSMNSLQDDTSMQMTSTIIKRRDQSEETLNRFLLINQRKRMNIQHYLKIGDASMEPQYLKLGSYFSKQSISSKLRPDHILNPMVKYTESDIMWVAYLYLLLNLSDYNLQTQEGIPDDSMITLKQLIQSHDFDQVVEFPIKLHPAFEYLQMLLIYQRKLKDTQFKLLNNDTE